MYSLVFDFHSICERDSPVWIRKFHIDMGFLQYGLSDVYLDLFSLFTNFKYGISPVWCLLFLVFVKGYGLDFLVHLRDSEISPVWIV